MPVLFLWLQLILRLDSKVYFVTVDDAGYLYPDGNKIAQRTNIGFISCPGAWLFFGSHLLVALFYRSFATVEVAVLHLNSKSTNKDVQQLQVFCK